MATKSAKQEAVLERQQAAKLAAARADQAVSELVKQAQSLKGEFDGIMKELSRYHELNIDEVLAFLKEPWCILPKGREEWWVIVPKWVGVQVGWLERATETYNIFVVNRYAHWLGNVPQELRDTLKLPPPFEAFVDEGKLRTGQKLTPHMKEHVSQDLGGGEYRVKKGHEFDLMAQLIEAGALPFKPRPVDPADLNQMLALRGELAGLRDYQKHAWDEFMKWGAIGVYWPWSAGKTVLGGYACARLVGEKLIVVPTRTLVEQWEERLRKWLDLSLRSGQNRIEIVTYSAWERVRSMKPVLAIFDECHRLPANTFSRLATIPAKYRIGLSATPYREDGRTNFIFALTGFPVGVDWVDFIRKGIITKPHVEVRIVSGWNEKVRQVELEVERTKGKTLVFCDSLDLGARVSARLKCPHVHGGTDNRLKVIGAAKVSVVSRVGDEGLSLPDLGKVIEVDFLGGSRRQEGQRVGRLLHADKPGQHIVLMTQAEFDSFERRFLALEEKGFKVNVVTQ
jgi:DNA excision repair protein ERCC-3